MSGSLGVRSFGKPYFAFQQLNKNAMNRYNTGDAGIDSLMVEFAVHALPQQRTSADELHMLLAVIDDSPLGGLLIGIGITPSGRVGVNCRAGGPALGPAGAIQADGSWHRGVARRNIFDAFSGSLSCLNDFYSSGASAATDGSDLFNTLSEARILLFNDHLGTSRGDVTIRKAAVACCNSNAGASFGIEMDESDSAAVAGTSAAYWMVNEKTGNTLVKKNGSEVLGAGDDFSTNIDLTLSASFWNPAYWAGVAGAVPTDDQLQSAYRRTVTTEYVDVTPESTRYYVEGV